MKKDKRYYATIYSLGFCVGDVEIVMHNYTLKHIKDSLKNKLPKQDYPAAKDALEMLDDDAKYKAYCKTRFPKTHK